MVTARCTWREGCCTTGQYVVSFATCRDQMGGGRWCRRVNGIAKARDAETSWHTHVSHTRTHKHSQGTAHRVKSVISCRITSAQ